MPDNSVYTGCGRILQDGQFEKHGKGEADWDEGRLIYEGDWEDNLQNGQGVETKEDGSQYLG